MYSQRSSGGSANNGQHRASTGATEYVQPQVRSLTTDVPLPDGDTAFYHLLDRPTPKATPSASPLLQVKKPDRTQLTVKQSAEQALAGAQPKQRELPGACGPTANCKRQSSQEQNADKENLLMGLHIPRFNIIESAFVLAVKAKLTSEAYKFMVSDLVSWTATVLIANKVRGCTEQEMMAVLQVRDGEECVMLSAQDGTNLVYIM